MEHGADKNSDYWKLVSVVTPESLKQIIEAGVDVNARDPYGYTAISSIAANRHLYQYKDLYGMVVCLAEVGADVNASGEDGCTPLMAIAARLGSDDRAIEAFKALAKAGANFDALNEDEYEDEDGYVIWEHACDSEPAHLASLIPSLFNIVRMTFANIDGCNRNSIIDVELMMAACWGSTSLIETTLSRGANVNARGEVEALPPGYIQESGYTPLMFASAFNNTEAVKLLIDAGANLEARTAYNYSALKYATERNWSAVIKVLLDAGAKPLGKLPP
jgi:ankyrin repeat protein